MLVLFACGNDAEACCSGMSGLQQSPRCLQELALTRLTC